MAQKAVNYPEQVLQSVKKHLADTLTQLEKRKKDITKEDPFTDPTRLEDNAAVDADAAEQTGHERVSAIKEVLDRSIIQIRKAMSRIKIGKYGVCEKCGEMIDTDRLMILPEATLCIKCQK